ncbi:FUSC family protein [Mycolicibacter minnesotensis]
MLLGTGPVAMAVVVLVALSAALLIGRGFLQHRPMFVNQTVISAILVLALPHSGIGTERLFDALVGGGIAAIFSIVIFPRNPVAVLADVRVDVLATMHDILTQTHCRAGDSDWMLSVAAALHDRLARLTEARGTAEQLARVCPLRWSLRTATHTADQQAAQLSLLATSVVQLARTITGTAEPLDEPVQQAVGELAAATAAVTHDEPAAAMAHATAARSHLVVARSSNAALLATAIDTCIDELDRVIGLAPQ